MRRFSRWEVSTSGFDPNLGLVGGGPYTLPGQPYYTGLQIPQFQPTDTRLRFLMLLAIAKFGAGRKIRLVGMRQLLTIGVNVANPEQGPESARSYPLELEVQTPTWRYPDGNICWHLMRIPPNTSANFNPLNNEGVQYQIGETPALLYETMGPLATDYVPPNMGPPPGTPVISDLGGFHDIRFPWVTPQAWKSLDIEIEGACGIALFASVRQTDPTSRVALVMPQGVTANDGIMSKEDAFVRTWAGSRYRRIAGSLIFEEEMEFEIPYDKKEESKPPFGDCPITTVIKKEEE